MTLVHSHSDGGRVGLGHSVTSLTVLMWLSDGGVARNVGKQRAANHADCPKARGNLPPGLGHSVTSLNVLRAG